MALGQRLDRCQVVGKVQGKERHQRFDRGGDAFVYSGRTSVLRTTEDDTVSSRRDPHIPGVFFDPADDVVDRLSMGDRAPPLMRAQHLSGRVPANEAGFGSEAFDLALAEENRLVLPALHVTGELDAGGAGIDDEKATFHCGFTPRPP